jgi:hypothetical protein
MTAGGRQRRFGGRGQIALCGEVRADYGTV